ncbi:ornithine cyclodeaminase family protein [Natronorarus salvus]|uniref:ornithine cyclodeaminase family protein n=1 Tax=Natronorarus salvus TaxID=3117733 RepID=UPI002F2670DA
MTDVRVLSEEEIDDLLSLPELLSVVEEAFLADGRGETVRPDRPHFPVGKGLRGEGPLGTGLTMPAYIHGRDHYATKLASVHPGNAERGLPTVNAQIALTDAETGQPVAYTAGTLVTNARTGCIGGVAARALCEGPIDLGVIGAGVQARWQSRAIAAGSTVRSIRIYSPSDSKNECAVDLDGELDAHVTAVDSPADAVSEADVVVTATTATEPVFPGAALSAGTVVIAVGAFSAEMREIDSETVDRAAAVIADVPEEVVETGDIRETGLRVEELIPLSDVLSAEWSREVGEIVLVESVGSAILDAAAAEHLFERAIAEEVGTIVGL